MQTPNYDGRELAQAREHSMRHRRITRSALALAFGLALGTGCDSIFGNNENSYAFSSQQIATTPGMSESVEISVLPGVIRMEGLFLSPSPCHRIEADYDRSGNDISLLVTATPTQSTCPAVTQAISYQADALGIEPGTYRVRVSHRTANATPRQITDESVSVSR
jgi:hypothetical protein